MQAISQCPSHVLLGQSFTNCQHQTCTSGLPSAIYTSGVQPTASFLEWVPISQWVEYWLLKQPPVLSRIAFAQAPLLWITYNPWLGDTKKKVLDPCFKRGLSVRHCIFSRASHGAQLRLNIRGDTFLSFLSLPPHHLIVSHSVSQKGILLMHPCLQALFRFCWWGAWHEATRMLCGKRIRGGEDRLLKPCSWETWVLFCSPGSLWLS